MRSCAPHFGPVRLSSGCSGANAAQRLWSFTMTSTPSDTPSPPTDPKRVTVASSSEHAAGPGAPGNESAPGAIVWKRGTILRLNSEVGFGYVGIESERRSYFFLLGKAILFRNSRDMKVGDKVAFHLDSGEKVERLVILPKKPRPKSALRRRVSGWAMTAVRMPRWLWALITEWLRQPKRRIDGADPP